MARNNTSTTPPPPPASSPPATPAPTNGTTANANDTVSKKTAMKKKSKNDGIRHNRKAKMALRKMHAFFKAHRDDDACQGLTYQEQQKVMGKLWKTSPENPKNDGT
ncbi:hypothetical protein OPT61_g8134 [Boeremia exigua]|uniref:Uncharacterized protein n=1 Tax=Boeremia exigua TaxID=749465 RepID=A0ACC2I0M0_9PLEO|nr:hypothetical protein OPT61_g8134 [Boeremia exigua]